MKKNHIYYFVLLLSVCFATTSVFAGDDKTENEFVEQALLLIDYEIDEKMPIIIDSVDINGNKFEKKSIIKTSFILDQLVKPEEGSEIFLSEKRAEKIRSVAAKSNQFRLSDFKVPEGAVSYFAFYLDVEDYAEFKLKIKSTNEANIFVNGEFKKSYAPDEDKKPREESISLSMPYGKYPVVIQVMPGEEKRQNLSISTEKNESVDFTINNKRQMTIDDIYSGKRVNAVKSSPTGRFCLMHMSEYKDKGKRNSWYEIVNISNKNYVSMPFAPFPGASRIKWGKDDSELFFTAADDKKTDIWRYSMTGGDVEKIAEDIENFGTYYLSPNREYILYTVKEELPEDNKVLRKIEGPEDRQSYFRKRYNLHYLDIDTKISYRLTYGKSGVRLHDISQDGKQILYSVETHDYQNPPFSRQTMFLYDFSDESIKTLWENRLHGLNCQFSPQGDKLLCTGSPDAFEGIGRNLPENRLANGYDTQAFIYRLADKKIEPFTKNFNPKVSSIYWNPVDYFIYIQAEEGQYNTFYKYNYGKKEFTKFDIADDCFSRISFATEDPFAVGISWGGQTPYRARLIDLKTGYSDVFADPAAETFGDLAYGDIKKFDYVKPDGDTIKGRIHYPPGFDSEKKYPVIVYYYGGTSPVGYSFGGRYPFNVYTGHGYIVYCLQPSGATGYGQEFSARHVNTWGIGSADDIIGGTKAMLTAHPYCDAENVGCMGASYGGFMTMLLTTKTDIFDAAISHAGISALSSYWGEGYWGYTYSAEASKGSYPWNNPKLYIEQSPLFRADKCNTPILLLHGDSDTNVPRGESIQFYTALKILGREAELVLIKDTDHWVQAYEQRIMWNNSILAWFDKHLKEKEQWWQSIYPDNELD